MAEIDECGQQDYLLLQESSKSQCAVREMQRAEGTTNDMMQRLKHEIQTRWHSKISSMTTQLTRTETIAAVASNLKIPQTKLPRMTQEQQNILVELIVALKEVRRVARELEADKNVSMSRAPRLIHELHDTLLIMSGNLLPNTQLFFDDDAIEETGEKDYNGNHLAHRSVPSTAD